MRSLGLLLLLIPHKGPEFSNFGIDLIVEVEPILLPIPNLQQVVIQGLLGNAYLLSSSLQWFLDVVPELIIKPSVKFPPECYLLDHFADLLLLVLAVHIVLLVFHTLLLNQRLDDQFAFSPHLQSHLLSGRRY